MLLSDFTINYRGVEITPQLEHEPMIDVLHYVYCEYNVCVAIDGLNELRKRTLDETFDNMGVK